MLEFGSFRIDTARRLLYRDGAVVDIPPKSFAVLIALVERRGQIVTKEDLLNSVWPETAVEENNLARSISTLRKALGEKLGENRYILTVPGRGYSFVAADAGTSNGTPKITETTSGSLSGNPRIAQLPTDRAIKAVGVFAAIVITTVVWVSAQARSPRSSTHVHFQSIFTSQQYPSAALSPDGKSLVYAAGELGRQTIRHRIIESGREIELPVGPNRSFGGLTFAPNGRHIFFIEKSGSKQNNILRELPLFGGPAREVAREIESPPTVSPDGSRLAFVCETKAGESRLVIHRLADGEQEELAATRSPTFLDYPAWSPDGQSIAHSEVTPDGVFLKKIEVHSRKHRRIGPRWKYIRRFTWLPEGDLLISAMDTAEDRYTLWRVDRSGKSARITESVDSLHSVAVSADGTRGITVAERSLTAVWVGMPKAQEVWKELLPAAERVKAAWWTTDGKILLERGTAAGRSIYIVNPDAKEPQQLLAPGPYHNLRLCSDGRTVAYWLSHPAAAGLWTTDLATGGSSRLVALKGNTIAECQSKDGLISFASKDPDWWPGLWKIPLKGGQPQQVSQRAGEGTAISADGHYAAYFDQDGAASTQRKATQIAVVSLNGSGFEKRFDIAPTVSKQVPLRWIPGSNTITYADSRGGTTEIWGQPINGGAPSQITSLSGGLIMSFDWSPDGKRLVLSRGMRSFELLLLELPPTTR